MKMYQEFLLQKDSIQKELKAAIEKTLSEMGDDIKYISFFSSAAHDYRLEKKAA